MVKHSLLIFTTLRPYTVYIYMYICAYTTEIFNILETKITLTSSKDLVHTQETQHHQQKAER